MSEFTDFLLLLWRIVRFVLDLTLYIIAAFLFVLACLLPWRWLHIWNTTQEQDFWKGFRSQAVYHFFLTLMDAVVLPLGLVGAVVPTRTYCFFADSFLLLDKTWSKKDFNFELRQFWFANFWLGIFEALCLVWCIPSLVVPTRLVAFMKTMWVQRKQLRWESLWEDDDADVNIFCIWILSPMMAFVEMLSLLSAVLIFVTVVRSCQTMREIREAWQNDATSREADRRRMQLHLYSCRVHGALLVNGASVLFDIVFLPLILLLTLTVWRLPPVVVQLKRSFDWKARAIILRQSTCLFIDFLLIVPLLLILLTVYRAKPVLEVLRRQQPHKDLGDQPTDDAPCADCCPTPFQRAVLEASGFLLMDLFVAPFIMMIAIMTFYRVPILVKGLSPGPEFHNLVAEQSLEMLIDIPCLLAGLLVVCTIVRADLVLPHANPCSQVRAWHRRMAVGEQLLYLCCDVASLLPLLGVFVTLYRLPSTCMKLKAKLSRPLAGEPEMQPTEVQVLTPQPLGKLGVRVVALKSPNFTGVSKVKVRVLGQDFWAAVAKAHGQMIATIGQSFMPLALKDGRDIDCRAIEYGKDEVELMMHFNYQVHRDAVLEYLDSLPWNTQALLQVEAKLKTGRSAILLTLASTMGALRDVIASDTGAVPDDVLIGDEDRIKGLRGASNFLRRNAWWAVVWEEFFRVSVDLLHVLLVLLLFLLPWRLVSTLKLVTERLECRPARHAGRAVAAVSLWERRCSKILADAEQLSIGYAKAAVIPPPPEPDKYMSPPKATGVALDPSNLPGRGQIRDRDRDSWENGVEHCIGCICCLACPCCPNYIDFDPWQPDYLRRSGDARQLACNDLNRRLKALSSKMKLPSLQISMAVKMWLQETISVCQPDGSEEWRGFLEALDQELALRSQSFFWLMLLSEVHLLLADRRIHPDDHSDLVEIIRARASRLVSKQADHRQQLLARFSMHHAAAFRLKGWYLKSWGMGRAIIREQLLKGITDVMILPGILLLIVTFYRLPRFCAEIRGRCDMAWVKVLLISELQGLLSDAFVLLQFLVLSILLTCTLVKFPDFIAGLRPLSGLRANRNWALLILSELVVGFMELLVLLTAWKTYRMAVSSVLFALLSPAAMLALAFPRVCVQKARFALASLVWLGLICCCLLTRGPVAQILAGCFLALSLVGLCLQRVEGWASRRPGGDDWWSPVVRCTLPNTLVLAAIGMEAALLTYAADRWAAGRASEEGDFWAASPEEAESVTAGQPALAEPWVITALVIAGVHLLLSAVPLVSADDDERVAVITDPAWRAAMSILQDVLFPFVTFALAPEASENWWPGLLLLYFVAISVLNGATWDEPLDHSALLDIRYFEVFLSGHRLLFNAAMLAAARSQRLAFIILAAILGCWTFASMLCGAASVLWVQVLRLAVCAGALVGVFFSFQAGCYAWAVAAFFALLLGIGAHIRRRWLLASTEVPAAMTRLVRIQARLSLWGDLVSAPRSLAVSPQGLAHQLIDLEGHLPFERLRLGFLRQRREWHHRLLQAHNYATVMTCLEELEAAVMVPPDRELLLQLLRKVPLPGRRAMPRPLVAEIIGFLDAGKRYIPEIKVPQQSISLQNAHLNLEGARNSALRAADQLAPQKRVSAPTGARRHPKRNSGSGPRLNPVRAGPRVHPERLGHPEIVELGRPPVERMTE